MHGGLEGGGGVGGRIQMEVEDYFKIEETGSSEDTKP